MQCTQRLALPICYQSCIKLLCSLVLNHSTLHLFSLLQARHLYSTFRPCWSVTCKFTFATNPSSRPPVESSKIYCGQVFSIWTSCEKPRKTSAFSSPGCYVQLPLLLEGCVGNVKVWVSHHTTMQRNTLAQQVRSIERKKKSKIKYTNNALIFLKRQ